MEYVSLKKMCCPEFSEEQFSDQGRWSRGLRGAEVPFSNSALKCCRGPCEEKMKQILKEENKDFSDLFRFLIRL